MQESQLPRFPWDKIVIDTSGPDATFYKDLITVMDLSMLYLDTYPLTNKSVETVAKLLNES